MHERISGPLRLPGNGRRSGRKGAAALMASTAVSPLWWIPTVRVVHPGALAPLLRLAAAEDHQAFGLLEEPAAMVADTGGAVLGLPWPSPHQWPADAVAVHDRRRRRDLSGWPAPRPPWEIWEAWPAQPPEDWPAVPAPWSRLVWFGLPDDPARGWEVLHRLDQQRPPALAAAFPWLWLDLESVGDAVCAFAAARFGWVQIAHVTPSMLPRLAAVARESGRPLLRADRLGRSPARPLRPAPG